MRFIYSQFKYLKSNTGFIRYFKNTGWMMVEQLFRIISSLVVGIWIAKYLGPEKFGIYSYVLAFTAIFAGIAKFGLDGIVIRELINFPEKSDILLGTAFWIKIFGAFFTLLIIGVIIPFTANDFATNIFVFIISVGLVFQSFEVVEFYFRSLVLARFVSICKVVQIVISSVLKICLIILNAELIIFFWVTLFDALVLAISYAVAYRTCNQLNFYKNFDLGLAKSLIKDSWPLIFSGIVVMIYMRIDQIMIKEILGDFEVGIYSAAVRISESIYFIPVIISASLFPAILNAKKNSIILYTERLKQLFSLLIWISIFFIIFITFFYKYIVFYLFGSQYEVASQVLLIQCWASVFVFLGVASSNWYVSENLQLLSFWRTFFGMLINIVLNYFFLERYGSQAAAYSTLLSQFFAAYLFDIFNIKTRPLFFMKTYAFNPMNIFKNLT